MNIMEPDTNSDTPPMSPTRECRRKKKKKCLPASETIRLETHVESDVHSKSCSAALVEPFGGTSVTDIHILPTHLSERARLTAHTHEKENTQSQSEKTKEGKTPLGILLISGRSGSGKSASAAQAFGPELTWIPHDDVSYDTTEGHLNRFKGLGFDNLGLVKSAEELLEADPSNSSPFRVRAGCALGFGALGVGGERGRKRRGSGGRSGNASRKGCGSRICVVAPPLGVPDSELRRLFAGTSQASSAPTPQSSPRPIAREIDTWQAPRNTTTRHEEWRGFQDIRRRC